GFPVNSAHDKATQSGGSQRMTLLNELRADTRVWDEDVLDAFPFHSAMEHLRAQKPRVLFLSLGETDTWAHAGNYANYLHAAHRADRFLKRLWETLQSMPEYQGKTSL